VHSLLHVVEDRSGEGFRTKQSLNAGQPAVSQVTTARHNQSCPLCMEEEGREEERGGLPGVVPSLSLSRRFACGGTGKQASVCNILLWWARCAAALASAPRRTVGVCTKVGGTMPAAAREWRKQAAGQ